MKRHVLVLLLILSGTMIYAQQGTLKGNLKDNKTQEALIGVNIQVKGGTAGTTTDVDGNYTLSLEPGNYDIVFSYVGYEDITKPVTIKASQTLTLDVNMGEAQSLLDEVVVTTSKFERKIGEETVSIDIIKPAALDKQNINDLGNALQRNSGVTVVDGQPNIRGGSGYSYGSGSRVLLLMDDLPMLQPDAGFASFDQFPIENVGQIEVIKGAASALYGTSAMNGIVNLRTAYPTSKPYAKISIFGSTIDNPNEKDYVYDEASQTIVDEIKVNKKWWELDSVTLPGSGTLGINDTTIRNPFNRRPYDFGISLAYREKIGKLDVVSGGQLFKKQGHKWGDYQTRGRFTINLRYRINEKISIGINSNVYASKSQTFFLWGGLGVNRYIPSAATGIPTESRSFRSVFDPFFRYADSKGNSHKILGRFMRSSVDNTNNQDNSSNFFYGEYQYQRRIDKINFVITGGIVANYMTSTSQLFGDTTHTGSNIAGYFQLDKKFWKRLNISYGFRFESFQIDEGKRETKPVSRVGINVEAAKYTFIRASFGQGYRFPTVAEKFTKTLLGTSFGIYPNPNLTSETGMSVELGIKQGIKLGKHYNAFLDVAAFYTQYDDMIEFNLVSNPGLGFQARNVGDTRIYGVETSVGGEGKLFGKFPSTMSLGYTYIMPQYRDYDENNPNYLDIASYNILKYRIRHQFVGVWDVDFKGFTFGLTAQYYSFMENTDAIFQLLLPSLDGWRASYLKDGSSLTDEKPKFKGDFILSVRAGYHFTCDNRDFAFTFLVNNITNREYTLRPTLVEAPRNFGFRMDMSFN